MTELDYHMCNVAAERDVVLRVDCALLAADDDDGAYDVDLSKWRKYTRKIYVLSHTWYRASGATRHMYEYKPCQDVSVCTASNHKHPVLGIGMIFLGVPQESAADSILEKVFHVPKLK